MIIARFIIRDLSQGCRCTLTGRKYCPVQSHVLSGVLDNPSRDLVQERTRTMARALNRQIDEYICGLNRQADEAVPQAAHDHVSDRVRPDSDSIRHVFMYWYGTSLPSYARAIRTVNINAEPSVCPACSKEDNANCSHWYHEEKRQRRSSDGKENPVR